MPPRTATVIVDAMIGPYSIKMVKVGAIAKTTGAAVESSMTKAGKSATALGNATGVLPSKFGLLAKVGGGAMAGLAIAGFAAAKSFADFDKAMDGVQASTGATDAELEQLGATAMEVAGDTKFSALEAAAGIEALGKAGISTADIIGGALAGAMDLAAAGGLEVAEAAEIAAGAMTQFNLSGSDVPHIADLIAAAAGKAQGDVADMGAAFAQGGTVASQMGLSLEETTGTLAAFASNALIGSDAGTSLKTMLLRLMNPSKEAATTMETLGIHAYSAQGQFVGLESLAGQLSHQMGGLADSERDAALATIFGSDAIRAANILYKEGQSGIGQWIENVDDAGFAQEQAAQRTDNLAGDLERLGGSVEQLGISVGETTNGPLRGFVQVLENIVDATTKAVTETAKIDDAMLASSRVSVHQARAMEENADMTARAASELEREAAMVDRFAHDSVPDATEAVIIFTEQLEENRKVAEAGADTYLSLSDAEIAYQQSVDDAAESLKENGATLDITTQKGRDNRQALDDQAEAGRKLLEQMQANGATNEEVAETQENLREKLITTATQYGMNKTEANNYADAILNVPTDVTTKATFISPDGEVANYKELLDSLPKNKSTAISLRVLEEWGGPTGGRGGFGFSSGFPLPGGPGAYRISQGSHDGGAIDYAAPAGTPIMASYSGNLTTANLGNRSYGKYYQLTGGGKYELGAHLQGFARGSGPISAGQLIGWVDSTGNSTGNHLHLLRRGSRLRNFHTGGWTGGGPINTLPGEYVVHAQAAASNKGLIEAINAGQGGAVQLSDTSISRLGRVVAGEIIAAVGAGAYSAGKRADLYSRAG